MRIRVLAITQSYAHLVRKNASLSFVFTQTHHAVIHKFDAYEKALRMHLASMLGVGYAYLRLDADVVDDQGGDPERLEQPGVLCSGVRAKDKEAT